MEINPNLSEKGKIDFALVSRALNERDQGAYSELMGKYKDSVYYMLLKMVNNRDDAMDLTVETFGKAFENLEKYKPDFAFSTWLFRIGTNNCIDFIRKKKLKTYSIDDPFEKDGDEFAIDLPSENLNPEAHMIKAQKKQLVVKLVDKLPNRYKKLITLRYFEELSYDEISQELDIPLGTVKAQLFRSKQLLNNILRKSKEKI
ncbi:MAG: RNA polymerase sigma factor (sigma-70 family) [Sphingobacteriales bacterium]|jgi:RNA polymerase sigma factor (sigma-70 family)